MRFARLLLVLGLSLAVPGCARYQFGPTNGSAAGARSVQVIPFENKTIEPRLTEPFTAALRRHVQQEGTFRLNTAQDGDIIVTGTLLQYVRNHISFQPRDVLTPRDYRITVTAQITARERATGKVLLDRAVSGRTDLRIGADLVSSERQALPLVADDLARQATALLADGSW